MMSMTIIRDGKRHQNIWIQIRVLGVEPTTSCTSLNVSGHSDQEKKVRYLKQKLRFLGETKDFVTRSE
jgi:hypothetical protein